MLTVRELRILKNNINEMILETENQKIENAVYEVVDSLQQLIEELNIEYKH